MKSAVQIAWVVLLGLALIGSATAQDTPADRDAGQPAPMPGDNGGNGNGDRDGGYGDHAMMPGHLAMQQELKDLTEINTRLDEAKKAADAGDAKTAAQHIDAAQKAIQTKNQQIQERLQRSQQRRSTQPGTGGGTGGTPGGGHDGNGGEMPGGGSSDGGAR
jgi:hypothetical protein